MKIIEIVIDKTGQAVIQTKGYAGSDCLQASRFIEAALGTVTNDQKTADYFQSNTTQQQAGQVQ